MFVQAQAAGRKTSDMEGFPREAAMSSGAAWRRTSPLVHPHLDLQAQQLLTRVHNFCHASVQLHESEHKAKRSSLPTWGDAEVSTSRLGIRILAVFIGPSALELDLIFARQSDNKRFPWPVQPVVQMPTAQ